MSGPLMSSPSNTGAQAGRGQRFKNRGGNRPAGVGTLRAINQRRAVVADAYHWMLNVSWPRFIAIIVGGYLAANLVFAVLYTLIPNAITGSSGFADNYFFSVQTWATIGYGGMTPHGMLPNMLVVVESMTGIFGVAMLTGLLFAKFSRPESRMLFADWAVVGPYNGKPMLMLRVANERGSHVVEATAHLTALRLETTLEGTTMRRLHDLKLVRDTQPIFRMSWTVMHVIDESSPLFGLDAKGLETAGVQLILSVMGYDASVGQTAHANHVYSPDMVLMGHRYQDATREVDGSLVLDFSRFHLVEPVESPR